VGRGLLFVVRKEKLNMGEPVKSFRDLRIWQRAMDLVPRIYRLAQLLPRQEQYALADQMRRAAVSVPTNIAEGQARRHTKEFVRYLLIARGSLAELQTLLLIAERLEYLTRDQTAGIGEELLGVLMPLSALVNRLQRVA
jgi:four helix bundle protein